MLKKIKEFLKKIFRINTQKCIEAPKEVIEPIRNGTEEKKSEFKNQIAVENEEKDRILKLQENFKAGLIKEEDLSTEDFDALTKLYEKQIEETKQSIEMYKKRIIYIKTKLAKNN